MSSLAEKIAARAASHPMIEVPVPELGDGPDAPLVLYFKPLTPAARHRAKIGIPADNEELLLVSALVELALDKKGARVFETKDKATLMNSIEVGLLRRIMEAASGVEEVDGGDVKNG